MKSVFAAVVAAALVLVLVGPVSGAVADDIRLPRATSGVASSSTLASTDYSSIFAQAPEFADSGWSRCEPITWSADTRRLSASQSKRQLTNLRWALGVWSRASGLNFAFTGTTALTFDEDAFSLTPVGGPPLRDRHVSFDFISAKNSQTGAPTGTATQALPAGVVSGLTIPWAAGGLRYDAAGKLEDFPGEWPSAPVHAVRLWDTRTAWLNIEPAPGQWDFSHLDANFDAATEHGVSDITMVLWGTPTWAAASLNANDAPWMGPGSAAPPADMADWDGFVRQVATRYAGRVKAYEIGNEPNLKLFWRGTPAQLADMVTRAATIIHEVDPAALVVAPAPYVSSTVDVTRFAPYLTALAASPARIDALAFHWYPASLNVDGLDLAWTALRRAAAQAGLPPVPIWVTEVGFPKQPAATATAVSRLIPRTLAMARSLGIERVYFYAWTDLPIGNLLALADGSDLEKGLYA